MKCTTKGYENYGHWDKFDCIFNLYNMNICLISSTVYTVAPKGVSLDKFHCNQWNLHICASKPCELYMCVNIHKPVGHAQV